MNEAEKAERTREKRLRCIATRQGFMLRKSKARRPGLFDRGGYMIVNQTTDVIEYGELFELSLDQVEAYLRQ